MSLEFADDVQISGNCVFESEIIDKRAAANKLNAVGKVYVLCRLYKCVRR